VVSLTDPIAKHIDPILLKLNGTRLEDHFGASIASVHVEHLLHMTSGLADYDGEAFARDQFAHRSKAFGPVEIIGKYVDPTLTFPPGTKQEYCSTNYILLGRPALVLAWLRPVERRPKRSPRSLFAFEVCEQWPV